MSLAEYRARRARLGFSNKPAIVLPTEAEILKSQVKQLIRRVVARDNEVALLKARLEAVIGEHRGSNGKRIASVVAQRYDLTFFDLLSRSRTKHLVRCRQHVMWELKRSTLMSLPEIGQLLGGLDHTTILHGIRRHQALIDAGEISG